MWIIRSEVRKRPAALTTLSQLRILNYLTDHALSTTQVADRMGVSLPSISRTVAALERKGWVKRRTNNRDRRGNFIVLTPQGRKILDQEREDVRIRMAKRIREMSRTHQKALEKGFKALEVLFL